MTNAAVGELIGLTHAGVSRIRSGERLPSITVMQAIAEHFSWDLSAQAVTRAKGGKRYSEEFERAIKRRATSQAADLNRAKA